MLTNKKHKKILITTSAVLLALNMNCTSTPKKAIVIPSHLLENKTEKTEESKPVTETKRYQEFDKKKVVTLGEPQLIKEEESALNNTLIELNNSLTFLKNKMENNEKIELKEICNLRNLYAKFTLTFEDTPIEYYTNEKGVIIKKTETKVEQIEKIEAYFFGNKKEIFEKEHKCFVSGEIIPTLIQLKKYSESKEVQKGKLSEKKLCIINDYTIILEDFLNGATTKEQKDYLNKIISNFKKVLPRNTENLENDCNILFPMR